MRKQWPPSTVAGGDAGGAVQFSRPHVSEYHSARSQETEQSKARRKAQCADLQGTGSATRCSRRRTRVATHAARRISRPCQEWNNRALETLSCVAGNTSSLSLCLEGLHTAPFVWRGGERVVLGDTRPRTANTWVSTWTGEQLVEMTQALDKPRHHTAEDGGYGARGARLTHSQTATPGERVRQQTGWTRTDGWSWWKETKRADPQLVEKSGPTAGRKERTHSG